MTVDGVSVTRKEFLDVKTICELLYFELTLVST